ncbi:MAG: response regulator, partial [Candidatus Binataceae bacterium]
VGNAIKFTAHGEVVLTVEAIRPAANGNDSRALCNSIAAAPTLALLRFSISDTGMGIAQDQIATIFSSFTQADSSMARKYGGSGLGLAIVKRLVELMNGEITVESQSGRGSTFSFIVPLGVRPPLARFASAADAIAIGAAGAEATAAETPSPISTAATAIEGPAGAGARAGEYRREHARDTAFVLTGLRVLVADDTAINRLIVRDVLAHAGVEITEAEDGGQALEALEHAEAGGHPYALAVLDGRMPGTDGIEVARRILGRPRPEGAGKGPTILLMLTADSLNPMRTQLGDLGLDSAGRCRYIVKPLKRTELMEAIASLFATPAPAITEDTARANADDGANFAGCRANGAMAPNAATGESAAASPPPLHILLAEDSPDNRLLIDAYLKNAAYRLDFAENGQAAIDRFKTEKYDLVLMDIQMPVVDGYTAVKAIRAWESKGGFKPTPIIALTASALEEAVRKSLAAGCTAHVAKPVRRATLLEAIKNAAGRATPTHIPVNGTAPIGGRERVKQRVVVRVAPDLSDLIPGFLEHKRADSKLVEAAIERADHETLSHLGHKMKGEGGSYGLDAISEIGDAIEQAAKARDLATIRLLAAELSAYLEAVEVVFE